MLGFSLRCSDGRYMIHDYACINEEWSCIDPVLCSYISPYPSRCSGVKDAFCRDGSCAQSGRCNGIQECFPHGEDEFWCPTGKTIYSQLYYRIGKHPSATMKQTMYLPTFPKLSSQSSTNVVFRSSVSRAETEQLQSQSYLSYSYSYICNRGLAAISWDSMPACFCPPAYYGHYCEYFSDRITVTTRVDRTSMPRSLSDSVLKIRASLLFNEETIDHHEFHSSAVFDSWNKEKFYLLYSRSNAMLKYKRERYLNRIDIVQNHPYSIHFDLYSLRSNETIEVGSWHYPVYFDFLPSHRLAPLLKFPMWFDNSSSNPCTNVQCPLNSICKPILSNGSTAAFYCSCRNGFHGKTCEKYENKCRSYCAPNAICKVDYRGRLTNKDNPFCVCPYRHFGPRCYLRYDECNLNPCLNNGTCHPTYDLSGDRPFLCICLPRFSGDRCEHEKVAVRIDIVGLTTLTTVRAVKVQFYDIHDLSLELQFIHQQVYYGCPSVVRYDHGRAIAPELAVLKTFDGSSSNLAEYFILYILPNVSSVKISSTPMHCPHVSTLLRDGKSFATAMLNYYQ